MEIVYNGATITISRGSVRSRLDCLVVYSKLDINDHTSDREFIYMDNYIRFLTQCQIKGDIGFPVPGLDASAEDIQAGYEAFLNADTAFYDSVIVALNSVDSDRNAPELLPDVPKKDSAPAK